MHEGDGVIRSSIKCILDVVDLDEHIMDKLDDQDGLNPVNLEEREWSIEGTDLFPISIKGEKD